MGKALSQKLKGSNHPTHFRTWKKGRSWLYAASVFALLVGTSTLLAPQTQAETSNSTASASSSTADTSADTPASAQSLFTIDTVNLSATNGTNPQTNVVSGTLTGTVVSQITKQNTYTYKVNLYNSSTNLQTKYLVFQSFWLSTKTGTNTNNLQQYFRYIVTDSSPALTSIPSGSNPNLDNYPLAGASSWMLGNSTANTTGILNGPTSYSMILQVNLTGKLPESADTFYDTQANANNSSTISTSDGLTYSQSISTVNLSDSSTTAKNFSIYYSKLGQYTAYLPDGTLFQQPYLKIPGNNTTSGVINSDGTDIHGNQTNQFPSPVPHEAGYTPFYMDYSTGINITLSPVNPNDLSQGYDWPTQTDSSGTPATNPTFDTSVYYQADPQQGSVKLQTLDGSPLSNTQNVGKWEATALNLDPTGVPYYDVFSGEPVDFTTEFLDASNTSVDLTKNDAKFVKGYILKSDQTTEPASWDNTDNPVQFDSNGDPIYPKDDKKTQTWTISYAALGHYVLTGDYQPTAWQVGGTDTSSTNGDGKPVDPNQYNNSTTNPASADVSAQTIPVESGYIGQYSLDDGATWQDLTQTSDSSAYLAPTPSDATKDTEIRYQARYSLTASTTTQTIHYEGLPSAPADNVQTITWLTLTDSLNNNATTTYYQTGDYSQDLPNAADLADGKANGWTLLDNSNSPAYQAVSHPTIDKGYHWTSTSSNGTDQLGSVAASPVTATDTNSTITVTYGKDSYDVTSQKVSQTVHYLDGSGQTIAPDNQQIYTIATVKDIQTDQTTDYYQSGNHTSDSLTSSDGTLGAPWGLTANYELVPAPAPAGYTWQSTTAPSGIAGDNGTILANPVSSSSPEYTEVYRANTQNLTYSVIDDTTGKTLINQETLATGHTNEALAASVATDYQAIQDSLTSQGYKIVSTDDLPASYGSSNQNLTIHVAHTYNVTPKAIHQTINYIGLPVPPQSNTQTLTFAQLTDKVTGNTTTYYQQGDHTADELISSDGTLNGAWTKAINDTTTDTDGFAEVPALTDLPSGYHWLRSDSYDDGNGAVAAHAANLADGDTTVNVTYGPIYDAALSHHTLTINYQDTNGKQLKPQSVSNPVYVLAVSNEATKNVSYYYSTKADAATTLDENGQPLDSSWTSSAVDYPTVPDPAPSGYSWQSSKEGDLSVSDSGTIALAVNPKADSTVTVLYTAQPQTVKIHVLDEDMSNQELTDYLTTLTGQTDASYSNEYYQTTLQTLEAKGYVIDLDKTDKAAQAGTYDNNSEAAQNYYIYVKHGTKSQTETKSLTRTINYLDKANNAVLAAPVTQEVTYQRTAIIDLVTGARLGYDSNGDGLVDTTDGEKAWTTNQKMWAEQASPDLTAKGYKTADPNKVAAQEVVAADQSMTVNVYYAHEVITTSQSKKVSRTIHYVYSDGSQAAADYTKTLTFTETVEKDAVTGKILSDNWSEAQTFATVNSPAIAGYTADKPALAAIEQVTQNSSDIVNTVTYTKIPVQKGTVTVRYIDENGAALAAADQLTGTIGADYVTTAKTIDGYHLKTTPDNSKGQYTANPITVTYTYQKDVTPPVVNNGTVTVHYVDESGTALAEPTTQTGAEGSNYTTAPKAITGYELIKSPDNATGTYSAGTLDVTYIYKKIVTPPVVSNGTVTVHYVDESGTVLSESTTQTGAEGSNYTTAPKAITGYELIQSPANATGIYSAGTLDVTYVYKKVVTPPPVVSNGTVTVHYMDESGTALSESTTQTGAEGSNYTTAPKAITGYELIQSPANATGTYSAGTLDVIYIYKKIVTPPPVVSNGTVTVHYVDESGTALAEPTTQTGAEGSNYTTAPKAITGYELIQSPANATGTYSDGTLDVTYVYKKVVTPPPAPNYGTVIVHYVDETGQSLHATTSLTGQTGQSYNSTALKISGYELVKSPANASGTYSNGALDVTYVYKKVETPPPAPSYGTVTVHYVDESGQPLHATTSLTGQTGESYSSTALKISGYELAKDSGNTTGRYTSDNIDVTYIYKKVTLLPAPPANKELTKTVNKKVPKVTDEAKINPQSSKNLPQTGSSSFSLLSLFGSLLLLVPLSILFLKRKFRKSK